MNRMISRACLGLPFWMAMVLIGLAWGRPAPAGTSQDAVVTAANRQTQFQCELDATGAIKLIFNEQSGGAGELTLTNQWTCTSGPALHDLRLSEVRKHDLPAGGIDWTEQSASSGLMLEYTLDLASAGEGRMGVADLRVRVTNQGKAPLAMRWRQQMAGLPAAGKIFGPSGVDFYELGDQDVALGYRGGGHGMTIPMATVFHPQSNAGYTVAASIDTPVPPFQFPVRRPQQDHGGGADGDRSCRPASRARCASSWCATPAIGGRGWPSSASNILASSCTPTRSGSTWSAVSPIPTSATPRFAGNSPKKE